MSKTSERFRRTTQRLLSEDREFTAAKAVICKQSAMRRAETATLLLLGISLELGDGGECARIASDLALRVEGLKLKLSHRAITASAAGEQSRVTETPAAAPVPPTVPSADFSDVDANDQE
jgi:hypothetical protein